MGAPGARLRAMLGSRREGVGVRVRDGRFRLPANRRRVGARIRYEGDHGKGIDACVARVVARASARASAARGCVSCNSLFFHSF